jgi:hypothetical protein
MLRWFWSALYNPRPNLSTTGLRSRPEVSTRIHGLILLASTQTDEIQGNSRRMCPSTLEVATRRGRKRSTCTPGGSFSPSKSGETDHWSCRFHFACKLQRLASVQRVTYSKGTVSWDFQTKDIHNLIARSSRKNILNFLFVWFFKYSYQFLMYVPR